MGQDKGERYEALVMYLLKEFTELQGGWTGCLPNCGPTCCGSWKGRTPGRTAASIRASKKGRNGGEEPPDGRELDCRDVVAVIDAGIAHGGAVISSAHPPTASWACSQWSRAAERITR
jgi:hypothetical protein